MIGEAFYDELTRAFACAHVNGTFRPSNVVSGENATLPRLGVDVPCSRYGMESVVEAKLEGPEATWFSVQLLGYEVPSPWIFSARMSIAGSDEVMDFLRRHAFARDLARVETRIFARSSMEHQVTVAFGKWLNARRADLDVYVPALAIMRSVP